jgi:hypothetical protein
VPSRDLDLSAESGPAIPSFGSLRDPRRRSAIDLLIPGKEPGAGSPSPEPAAAPPAAAAPAAPRPPEWSDLLHLAVHVTRWSLGVPFRGLRRLLGG